MRTVKTISVSLEAEYVTLLEDLARRTGSKSAAVRLLLKEHEEREMEQAYREYYADPKNVEADLELTKAMRSIAGWPEEWVREERRRGGNKRASR
jgi:hypothetical protein